MTCPSCNRQNRDGARFCGGCGGSLALRCPACGAESAADARFCDACGAPLAAKPAEDAGARKVVTIVFADLVGSTALHERLDAESARRFVERYYAAMRDAVAAHGGTVAKLLGDGVMAVFGVPRVAEDDALRAVRAAVAMQDAFGALAAQQRGAIGTTGLRVAVNTGEVVVKDETELIGDPVNVAARLQDQGRDGDVVIGEATRQLVAGLVTLEPLGSVALKGRAEAVSAYRVVSLERPASATTAAFVGRADELARLTAVFDAAVAAPAARLAVLLGSPGLGKSRLIDEFVRRHGDAATVLLAQCDAAGGATFAPLARALRERLGIDDGAAGDALRAAVAAALPGDDAERIGGGIAALLAGSPASPEETFFVVRRLLTALAAERPVVLVIDDLHWAEPLLLDLVEHLVQWGGGVPLLILVGARPELRDTRSALATPGGLVADVVTLAGLDAGAATRLAANVIGAADLPAAVAARVLATSEGNPLFVGELVRMLVQEGALTKDGERWTAGAGLAALEMPPTIHALLAARIERLRPEERTVLERAAVVGRHFSRSAVAALAPREAADLDARLEALRRSELIERDTGWFLGEPGLRFHHVLIRDAAYRRVLKETRAELHGRLADWIEARVGDAPEHDETIGWHLEQAHQHLRELGPLDAAGTALGERAAHRLAAAGRRALARDDVSLAGGLLGRALDRLGTDAPERADLVLDWCEALLSAGAVGPAAAAIDELGRVAADSARLRAWHTCFAGQLTVLTAPETLHATSERVGAAARELAALDDAAGEAKAHFVHAQALARLGKVGACEAALDQALAAARRAGDRRRANAVLAGAPLAALWGPSPVTRASGRCLDVVRVLRITQGAPAVEAVALCCQGVLEALRGRTEAARRMLASSRTMVEELGIGHRLFETDVFAGRIELLEGDAPAAERALRSGYDGLRDLGLGIDAARAAALLGRALLAQGRAAEAESLSHESELLAGDDLQAAIAWRGVRAEALARRGDHAAAIGLAEAAVAIAAATDALLDHADARLALAAAFRVGGRRSEADAEERRAFELWEAKGATVLAERARRTAADDAVAPAAEARSERSSREPRRVRPNAATAQVARGDAAIEAGDSATCATLFHEAYQEIDHPTGSTYGRDAAVASIERLTRSRDVSYRTELLATLGPSLVLGRRRIRASGTTGQRFDVGPYENETISLHEVDARGLYLRHEVFAPSQLGAAVTRLYERHAARLPEGPGRERAAVAARAVAWMLLPGGTPDLAELYSPTYVDVDHRSVGYGTLAPEDSGKLLGSWRELADDVRLQVDDVLALDPNGFVRKTRTSGVWREGGGSFERTVCTLSVFGPDGRVTHHETFDADREVEALARFDALTTRAAPPPPVRRRVRPNAATVATARFDGAFAARDETALAAVFAEALAVVDHPNGAAYGRDGVLESFQRLLRMDGPTLHHEPLATLGESLGIFRRHISGSGGRLGVGEYERDEILVYEVDADGRFRHVEAFAAERLRSAVVRLYERHAESLPEGAARTRVRGLARSLAVFDGAIDADRVASRHAPSFVAVDHRTLGTWSATGREAWLRHWREQADLAADFAARDDDVLALDLDGGAFRTTFAGTSRASGGAFENVVVHASTYDADGVFTRTEIFEPGREAEALACFDALTAGGAPERPVRRQVGSNVATRTFAALEAAFARRDLAAVDALLGDPLETIEHPTATRYGREGQLESSRRMMRMPNLSFRIEPLATLGDELCLARRLVAASGTSGGRFDVAAYEIESLVVSVVDAGGRLTASEVFASGHLCQAIARLYALYAESLPDGPERTRAAGIASTHAVWNGPVDVDRVMGVFAPSFVCVDHRSLRTWSADGLDEFARHWRGQTELAAGFSRRDDDILALAPGACLMRRAFFGINRATGGPFENVYLGVDVFGADGRYTRCELFEPDAEVEALARFDALVGSAAQVPSRRPVRRNDATRGVERFEAALAARDPAALAEVFHESLDVVHHPTAVTYGRREMLATWRSLMKAARFDFRSETLATLGDALLLERHVVAAEGFREARLADAGAIELEELALIEADEHGRWRHNEIFAAERFGEAISRLYERHAEVLPDGPARVRAAATARALATFGRSATDPDRFAAALSPSIVAVDHRTAGFGELRGRDAVVAAVRALLELSEDVTWRLEDVLGLSEHACLMRATQRGRWRASSGEWERAIWLLLVHDADGLVARWEIFEAEHEAAASARWDALVGSARDATSAPAASPCTNAASALDPLRVPPNAAMRAVERVLRDAWPARDLDAFRRLAAPDFRYEDRGRRALVSGGVDTWTSSIEFWPEATRLESEPIGSFGNRIMVDRLRWRNAPDADAFEVERLTVYEVDESGRLRALIRFDPEDRSAALAEAVDRFVAGEAAAEGLHAFSTFGRALASQRWDEMRAVVASDFVFIDHRTIGLGTLDGGQWITSLRALAELAPDLGVEITRMLAWNRHGLVVVGRNFGTGLGGGPFENVYVLVVLIAGGRVLRIEGFEPAEVDRAVARFAELCEAKLPARDARS